MFAAALLDEFGETDAESNAEPLGLVEQADGLGARHLGFEEAIDLALLVKNQRGKKVVKASSGKTTRSQPRLLAWRRSSFCRLRHCARVSDRAIGPICAAPATSFRALMMTCPS